MYSVRELLGATKTNSFDGESSWKIVGSGIAYDVHISVYFG